MQQDLLPDWFNKSKLSHEEITSIIGTGKRLCANANSILSDSLELSLTEELAAGVSRAKESLAEFARLEELASARLGDDVRARLAVCSADASKISKGVEDQLQRLKLSNERCRSLISDYREHSRKTETHLDLVFSERLVGTVDGLAKAHQKELSQRLEMQLSGLDKTCQELKSRISQLVDVFAEETKKTLTEEKNKLQVEVDDLREKVISELENGYLANKNLLRETCGHVEQLELAVEELSRTQSESMENCHTELGSLALSVSGVAEKTLMGGLEDLSKLRLEQLGSTDIGLSKISELSATSIRSCVKNVSEVVDLQNGSYDELASCVEDHFVRALPAFQLALQAKTETLTHSLQQVAGSGQTEKSPPGLVAEALRDLIQVEDVLAQPNPSSGQTPRRSQTFQLPIVKERCLSPLKYVEHFIEVLPKPVTDFSQLQKAVDPFLRAKDSQETQDSLRTLSVSEFIHEQSPACALSPKPEPVSSRGPGTPDSALCTSQESESNDENRNLVSRENALLSLSGGGLSPESLRQETALTGQTIAAVPLGGGTLGTAIPKPTRSRRADTGTRPK